MSAQPPPSSGPSFLPQYGFGAQCEFHRLVNENPFLFRVYTPKERSPFADDSEPFFVGPKFDEKYSILASESQLCPSPVSLTSTYADVSRHMDWTTRSTSPYISTSFSFMWSVWEALRRYHKNIKHDVHIAVIDANAISHRCTTAIELLQQCQPKQRHRDHWKWFQFAQESQSVLVYESIPRTAIYASIPLLSIVSKLPSYCLRTEPDDEKLGPLDKVAWDYTQHMPSYRQFCQDMSDRFFRLSAESRMRDATSGSVGLAIAFLQPWFHKAVVDDFRRAIVTLCSLSLIISHWPGQWWVKEQADMRDIIQSISSLIGEEVRENHKGNVLVETQRLQTIIDELERSVLQSQKVAERRRKRPRQDSGFIQELPPTYPPRRTSVVKTNGVSDFASETVVGAEGLHNSDIVSMEPTLVLPDVQPPGGHVISLDQIGEPSPLPMFSNMTPEQLINSVSCAVHAVVSPDPDSTDANPVPDQGSEHESDETVFEDINHEPEPEQVSGSSSRSNASDTDDADDSELASILERFNDQDVVTKSTADPMLTHTSQAIPMPVRQRKSPGPLETASYALTCFLIGTFITLCILSPHRRALATHLT